MPRPRITWSDSELRAIMASLIQRDQDYPLDNGPFLRAWIDDIRAATGKLFGAMTYSRLLRDLSSQTGVTRRPSTSTIQKEIGKAQALEPTAIVSGDGKTDALVDDGHAIRRALEPMVRDLLGSVLVASQGRETLGSRVAGAGPAPSLQLEVAEAALIDALSRIRRLEEENAALRREAASAIARAEVAESQVPEMLDQLMGAFSESAGAAGALMAVSRQLSGTETFLKLQNDAVRVQATAERDTLRAQVKHLQERVDHLILESDQYRRAALARRPDS